MPAVQAITNNPNGEVVVPASWEIGSAGKSLYMLLFNWGTAVGEHHRHVAQHPPAVVDRHEGPACHRRRQLARQPGPVGQQPQRGAARVRHHAGPITRD
jgi:hypothetical protein